MQKWHRAEGSGVYAGPRLLAGRVGGNPPTLLVTLAVLVGWAVFPPTRSTGTNLPGTLFTAPSEFDRHQLPGTLSTAPSERFPD
jgi:hypothetical protein